MDATPVVPFTPDVLRKRLGALKAIHKVVTIKHGPRHTFASYWLALHGDINQLCLFLGHDDPQTTFKHYAKAATKREAEKFWAIMPKTTAAKNVIAFRKRSA
jgi:Phage integrase family.